MDTEDDLPVIWQMMAKGKRDGEPLATLMKTQTRLEADYFRNTAPSISVPHKLSLKQFQLGGDDNNSKIDLGILPFMVTLPEATSEEAALGRDDKDKAMLDYGIVSEATNGLSLTDARVIHKGHAYIPPNWDEGTDQLWTFLATFASIYGCRHHVTAELHVALKLFVKHHPFFKKRFSALWGCRIDIVKLVHYFHSKIQRWYSRQWDSTKTGIVKASSFQKDLYK